MDGREGRMDKRMRGWMEGRMRWMNEKNGWMDEKDEVGEWMGEKDGWKEG